MTRAELRSTLSASGISSRVADALLQVPRDKFVAEDALEYAWADESLRIGHGQTISQPSLVGKMIDLLETRPDHRILDVGTGSGYQAAILSLLVKEVISVERVAALRTTAAQRLEDLGYDNVSVFQAEDGLGWPELAPYDGIIVGAAAPRLPEPLITQLKVGGRLVVPVGVRSEQRVYVVLRTDSGVETTAYDAVRFVPLIGKGAWDH